MKATPSYRRRAFGLAVAAITAAAVSTLPAGIGNLGRQRTLSGSQVDVTLPGGVTFTHIIVPGQTTSQVRDSLVSQINAHASFEAIATSDPGDSNAISFRVFNTGGSTVTSLAIRETDANMQNGGSFFTAGATTATLRRPSVSPNPSTLTAGIYRLMIDLWDDPDFDHTFATGPSGITTSAALEAAIISELTTAGFGVATGATTITITRPGDKIMAIRVDSEGSGLIENSYGISGAMSITPVQPVGSGVPTLSQYGMFALVLLMTAAAFVIMRRKSAAAR